MDRRSRQSNGARSRGAKTSLVFPVLKGDEILTCMQELEVDLAADELAKPTPEVIRRVFECCIEFCLGTGREELNQAKFAGLQAFSYPELHEDSVPSLALFRAAKKLMDICGYPQFSMKDILKPTAARFREQISGIINFAKFREERIEVYEQHAQETDDLVERRRKLMDDSSELQRKLESLRQKREEQRPTIDALEGECKEMEGDIDAFNKRQALLRHEMSEMKKENSGIRDRLAELQFHLLNAKQEKGKLEAQIVRSPDRLKKELEGLADTLERDREEAANVERKARDVTGRCSIVGTAVDEVKGVAQMVDEAEGELQKAQTAEGEAQEAENRIREIQAEVAELETRKQHTERQIARANERLSNLQRRADLDIAASSTALRSAEEEREALEERRSEDFKKADEAAAQLRGMQAKATEEAAKREHEVANMKEGYGKVLGAMRAYHSSLLQNITNVSE